MSAERWLRIALASESLLPNEPGANVSKLQALLLARLRYSISLLKLILWESRLLAVLSHRLRRRYRPSHPSTTPSPVPLRVSLGFPIFRTCPYGRNMPFKIGFNHPLRDHLGRCKCESDHQRCLPLILSFCFIFRGRKCVNIHQKRIKHLHSNPFFSSGQT